MFMTTESQKDGCTQSIYRYAPAFRQANAALTERPWRAFGGEEAWADDRKVCGILIESADKYMLNVLFDQAD